MAKTEEISLCISDYEFKVGPRNIGVSWSALLDKESEEELKKREMERAKEMARYSYKMTNVTVKLHAKDKRDVVFDLTKTFYTKVFRRDKGKWTIYSHDIDKLIKDSFKGTDIVDWWFDCDTFIDWDGTPCSGRIKWEDICNINVWDTNYFGE